MDGSSHPSLLSVRPSSRWFIKIHTCGLWSVLKSQHQVLGTDWGIRFSLCISVLDSAFLSAIFLLVGTFLYIFLDLNYIVWLIQNDIIVLQRYVLPLWPPSVWLKHSTQVTWFVQKFHIHGLMGTILTTLKSIPNWNPEEVCKWMLVQKFCIFSLYNWNALFHAYLVVILKVKASVRENFITHPDSLCPYLCTHSAKWTQNRKKQSTSSKCDQMGGGTDQQWRENTADMVVLIPTDGGLRFGDGYAASLCQFGRWCKD